MTAFDLTDRTCGRSIGKGTAIKPVSDVDLYLYLDEAAWQTTRGEALRPSTIIGRLRSRVATRLHFELDAGHATIRKQGLEVIAMFVVTQGCKRTALGVLQAALEFMGTTNMRTPVYIERYYKYRPHRRRVCTILDPAMPDNDLGAHLDSGAGDRLGVQARRALRRLEKAARLAEKGRLQSAADEVSEAFGEPGLITLGE